MKFTENRLETLSAVQSAGSVAPAASPMDILKCVCLVAENGALTVAATNMDAAVERKLPAEIREDGRTAIDARLLAEMLRLLGGDTVTFEQVDAPNTPESFSVSVKSGEAEYRIPAMNAGEYHRAEIPFLEDTVTVTGIPDMAKRTAFAALEKAGDTRRCVFLRFDGGDLSAVSTDGFRIASAKGER